METRSGKEKNAAPRQRAVYWAIALSLAGVLLYYSLRGIEWLRVWDALRGARPAPFCLALAAVAAAMFLRALRWRVLLMAEGPVSVPLAFWATAAGYLGNNVLPARAGEVVRTLMVARRSRLSKTFVLTTALFERVSDAIVLITISSAVLLAIPVRPGWLADAARPFAVAGFCGVAMIALLPRFEWLYLRILARLRVPVRLRGRVEETLGQAIQGIRSFHDARRLARFISLTVVIWCMDAVTATLCARAVSVSLSPAVAFLLLAGLGLGSALPSTPGYIGIYQFVAISILTPFGITNNDAIACILLMQALVYVVVLIFGGAGLVRERGGAAAEGAAAG